MILVAGATGHLGLEICRLLREKNLDVRALVRPTSGAEKVGLLREMGVSLAYGDLKDPRTLDAACQGVDAVISTASSTISRQPDDSIQAVDHEGQIALVDAAVDNGVEHYVFISVSGNLTRNTPLLEAKRSVERAVMESGMTYTILRPSFFVEVWLSPAFGFDVERGHVRIFGTGDQRTSWISLHDVARFAVASLEHPAARNAVFELGGEAVSPNELLSEIEQRTGKRIDVERIPAEVLEAQLEHAESPLDHTITTLCLSYAEGDEIELGRAREIDVPIRSARELVGR